MNQCISCTSDHYSSMVSFDQSGVLGKSTCSGEQWKPMPMQFDPGWDSTLEGEASDMRKDGKVIDSCKSPLRNQSFNKYYLMKCDLGVGRHRNHAGHRAPHVTWYWWDVLFSGSFGAISNFSLYMIVALSVVRYHSLASYIWSSLNGYAHWHPVQSHCLSSMQQFCKLFVVYLAACCHQYSSIIFWSLLLWLCNCLHTWALKSWFQWNRCWVCRLAS